MTCTACRDECGVALLHVVLLLAMVTAAAGGAATLARIEVFVSHFQRGERDAAYAAQGMVAATLRELDRTPDWNAILSGTSHAAFADGANTVPRQIPGGGTVTVCCAPGSMTARARASSTIDWEPYAWQSVSVLLNTADAPRQYVVSWIADDPDDADGDGHADSNGRLLVRAEAASPLGLRKGYELLVERAPLDLVTGVRPPGVRILSWQEAR